MTAFPNIYPHVAFELPPRLKELLMQYARAGQIDCDGANLPYLLSVIRAGKNTQAFVVRNGTRQSIVMNTRARVATPILSWDLSDGYRAHAIKPMQVGAANRSERGMRTESVYTKLVSELLESS